ncbi:flagellar basal body rod C-terminal domain-containing protein, partial [Candidatus Darwinibacter acetoxidans]|nr:flagellar basal body rod C-terminal domain-containing protein [Limnochordia bacterium]HQE36321.1 flagellar basal body rod C-terminal domain-containing protein [Limnochordia bacterium]
AIRMTENQVVLENHLQNLKESISGVSLDEEMANMIRFQHAYNAAARMMTAVDETLDTIINRLGIVGR